MSEDRLFSSIGFFNIRDEEILLYRIRDISIKRTLWQRIFGVGNVIVTSSDKSTPQLTLKNIKYPLDLKELLHESVEECKLQRRMRISEMMTDCDHSQNGIDLKDNDLDPEFD